MLIDGVEMEVFKIVEKKEDIIPTIKIFEEDLMKIKHDHTNNHIEKAFMKWKLS